MYSKTGYDTLRTTAGTQHIVTGFQPKLIFVVPIQSTTLGTLSLDLSHNYGVAALGGDANVPGGQLSFVNFQADVANGGNVGFDCYVQSFYNAFITMASYAGGIFAQASLVSLDPDGFTIDVTTPPSQPYIFMYLALGGTEFEDTYLGMITTQGTYTGGGGPGNGQYVMRDYTTPFTPDFVYIMSRFRYSTHPPNDLYHSLHTATMFPKRNRQNYIVPAPPVNGVAWYPKNVEGVSWGWTDNTHQYSHISDAESYLADSSDFHTITFYNYLVNGFRLVVTGWASQAPREHYYLAIKGDKLQIGGVLKWDMWDGPSYLFKPVPPSNTDFTITVPTVTNPQAALCNTYALGAAGDDLGGWSYGDAPRGGSAFIDKLGNQMCTSVFSRGYNPFWNHSYSRSMITDGYAFKNLSPRDGHEFFTGWFKNWIPGSPDGQILMHRDVSLPCVDGQGFTYNYVDMLVFGSEADEQSIGQGSMVV